MRPRRWEALIRRIPTDRPIVGVEVGVFKADTAASVLAARRNVTHYLVDPWAPYYENDASGKRTKMGQMMGSETLAAQIFAGVQRRMAPFGERAVIYRGTSADAATELPNELDYVFIDGIHTYEAVKHDIAAWLPKVKRGGWIGGHDYDNLPRFPGVARAVDEAFNADRLELDADHTWWMRLPE